MADHRVGDPRWLRRNRFWLVLVPIALVAMLAASSYRVKTFWWEEGLHHADATAATGQFVSSTGHYTDPAGRHTRTYRVRLDGVAATTAPAETPSGPFTTPAGTQVVSATLDFAADPDVPMDLCQVALFDDHGHQYGGDTGSEDPFGQVATCVPDGHEGPLQAIVRGQVPGVVEAGHERPATWSVSPLFLVPTGTRIVSARVWFSYPGYVSLPVPG